MSCLNESGFFILINYLPAEEFELNLSQTQITNERKLCLFILISK